MFDLNALGFTPEEIKERVLDRICDELLTGKYWTEDEGEYTAASQFKRELDKRIKDQVTETINDLAGKHVLPNVANYIENLMLQQTNEWGEKRGEPVSFIEYLTQRADAYMQEKVDSDGKSKIESNSYSWSGKQTRITHMVHKHLHYSIETAMKEAMSQAQGAIVQGIEGTVKAKLAELSDSFKVAISAKR